MATRHALRLIQRRFSSSGKVLREEEKAAENVFIKKMEKEKLEKHAREGPKGEQTAAGSSGGSGSSVPDAKPSESTSSSTSGESTDRYWNYALVVVLGLDALTRYLEIRDKNPGLKLIWSVEILKYT